MFAKFSLIALVVACPLQALGHALIEPAIGVAGAGARSDVQRPSTASPCGKVNVASALAGSTAVQATNNAFTVSVQNFNAGKDGSTQITSTQVDPTGTGDSFTGGAVTITQNGVLAPKTKGTAQVSGTLPAGTQCTGGTDGASCLVSFTTAGKFGNCVLVSQGAGGAAAGTVADTSASNATATDVASNATITDAASNATVTDTADDVTVTDTADNATVTEVTGNVTATDTAVESTATTATNGTTTTTTTTGKGKNHHKGAKAKAQNRRMIRRRLSPADLGQLRREIEA